LERNKTAKENFFGEEMLFDDFKQNIKREESLHLSKAWKPLLHKINEKRRTPDTQ
jgi:hypothetical protein